MAFSAGGSPFVRVRAEAEQDLLIEAVGPKRASGQEGLSNAWILDARTRSVVWEFERAPVEEPSRHVRQTNERVRLAAGLYEVCYAAFPPRFDAGKKQWWEDASGLGELVQSVVAALMGHEQERDWRTLYQGRERTFGITVRGERGRPEPDLNLASEPFLQRAFLTLTGLGNDVYARQGFMLDRLTEIEVYALGEQGRTDEHDYGWILDVQTGERVWSLRRKNMRPAGGAEKNGKAQEVLRLPAGRYAAFTVTDGEHAYGAWNAAPPYDPAFWGLTLRATDPEALSSITLFPYDPLPEQEALFSLRGLGDDEYRSADFTLEAPADLRIYALGEGDWEEMYDYGWIVDARTGAYVWTMQYDRTTHAGGAEKNRLFNNTIRLPAGSYTAYFMTDDSHSYDGWNAGPPYDPAAWGMAAALWQQEEASP